MNTRTVVLITVLVMCGLYLFGGASVVADEYGANEELTIAAPASPDFKGATEIEEPPADWQPPAYNYIPATAVIVSSDDAIARATRNFIDGGGVAREAFARLVTHKEASDARGVGMNYALPGIPDAETPVWFVAFSADGGIPNTHIGLIPGQDAQYAAPAAYVIFDATTARTLVRGLFTDMAKYESLKALKTRDLRISKGVIAVVEEDS